MKRFHILVALCLLALAITAQPQPTLRQKIGQMLMVGFSGAEIPDSLITDINSRNLGGVVCLAYNLQTPEQIKQLTTSLQDHATTPLLIAVDQEGGLVARLDERNGFIRTPSAYHLGTEVNTETATREAASTMAGWLAESGFNVNLAPVVDVNVNPSSPAIGYLERSFSSHPRAVAKHAGWFIDEFHRQELICCLKHFPGHGSAREDSHDGFTDITSTWSSIELYPYRALLNSGFDDIIMTGHLYNATIDSLYPATLSHKTITGVLREEMGYHGAVISDAMYMRAIRDNYSFEKAIELAINAGVDILLYTTHMRGDRSLVGRIQDIVEARVKEGVIEESRIDSSYQRVMDLKQRLGSPTLVNEKRPTAQPESLELAAYPNPFNSTTQLTMTLYEPSDVQLDIFSVRGQRVRHLNPGTLPAGSHRIRFDAGDLPTGVYMVRLQTTRSIRTQKITLIR
jgi:beta-N-acetylhexosaminidase